MSAERTPSAFDEARKRKEEAERREEFEKVQGALDLHDLSDEDREAYESYQAYLEQRPETEAEAAELNAHYLTDRAQREQEELFAHPEEKDTRFEGMSLTDIAREADRALKQSDVTTAMDASHALDDRLHELATKYGWSDEKLAKQKERLEKFYDADKVHEIEERALQKMEKREKRDESYRQEQIKKFQEVEHERQVRGDKSKQGIMPEDIVPYTESHQFEKKPEVDEDAEAYRVADEKRQQLEGDINRLNSNTPEPGYSAPVPAPSSEGQPTWDPLDNEYSPSPPGSNVRTFVPSGSGSEGAPSFGVGPEGGSYSDRSVIPGLREADNPPPTPSSSSPQEKRKPWWRWRRRRNKQ